MVEVFRHEHSTRNLICKTIPVWSTGVGRGGSGDESGTPRGLRPTQAVSAAATVPLTPAPRMGHRPFGAPRRDAVEADASGRPAEPHDGGQWIHGRRPPPRLRPRHTAIRALGRRPRLPAAGSAADPQPCHAWTVMYPAAPRPTAPKWSCHTGCYPASGPASRLLPVPSVRLDAAEEAVLARYARSPSLSAPGARATARATRTDGSLGPRAGLVLTFGPILRKAAGPSFARMSCRTTRWWCR